LSEPEKGSFVTTFVSNARRFKGTAAMAAIAVAVVSGPLPADATTHYVKTVTDGGWLPTAKASEHEEGAIEYWSDFRVGEIRSPKAIPTNLICGYQAAISWQSPSGSTTYDTTFSTYHAGCVYEAWKDFGNYDGGYVENTRFPTKWKSNHTTQDNWVGIGTLRD
jgi:hypothetical protein